MKRLTFLTFGIAALFATAVLFNSCSEDPEPVTPTLQFVVEVDGYNVTITAEATDAEIWAWDYGDGNISVTAGSHSHSYEESGSYTISCTVTSKDDLTATKTESVTIAASVEELIAGTGDGGKTWVLTQVETTYVGKVGGGLVTNDVALLPEMSLVIDGMLAAFGLGDEYADEFTFYRDGTLAIDLKNDRSLAGIVYGQAISPNDFIPSTDWGLLPMSSIPGQNITDATWSLSYEDKTVQWYDEFVDSTIVETTFTFPEDDPNKIAELVLSEGAYVCFTDLYYPEPYATGLGLPGPVDNSLYILKEVTGDMMNIAVGLNSWPDFPHLPSLLIHLVLVPAQ